MTEQTAPLTAEQQETVLNNLLTECAILRKWIDQDTASMNAIIARAKETDRYLLDEADRANNAKLLAVREEEAKAAALALYDLTKVKKQPGVTVKTMTTEARPVYDHMKITRWAITAKPGLLVLDVPKF
jgi:K+/H+ antiporter YhaU regulatory subunit KhtT